MGNSFVSSTATSSFYEKIIKRFENTRTETERYSLPTLLAPGKREHFRQWLDSSIPASQKVNGLLFLAQIYLHEQNVDALAMTLSDTFPLLTEKDTLEKGHWHLLQSGLMRSHQNWEKALEFCNQAIQFFETTSAHHLALAYGEKGILLTGNGQWEKGVQMLKDFLAEKEASIPPEALSKVLNIIAVIYTNQERSYDALKAYYKALAITKTINDPLLDGKLYANICTIFLGKKHFHRSIEYAEKAIPYYNKSQYIYGLGVIHSNIGVAYGYLGKHKQALGNFEAALEIWKKIQHHSEIGRIYINLADTLFALEEKDAVPFYYLNEALKIAKKHNLTETEYFVYSYKGKIYKKTGQEENAKQSFALAFKLAQKIPGNKTHFILTFTNVLSTFNEFSWNVQDLEQLGQKSIEDFNIIIKNTYKEAHKNKFWTLLDEFLKEVCIWQKSREATAEFYDYQTALLEVKDQLLEEKSNRSIEKLKIEHEAQKLEQEMEEQKKVLARQKKIFRDLRVFNFSVTEENTQLQQQTKDLILLANALPYCISYVSKDLKYQFNNQTYTDWFGIKSSDLKGKDVRIILNEEGFNFARTHFEQVLKGASVQVQQKLKDKNNNTRDLNVRYNPSFDSNGKVKGFYVIAEDITQYKSLEKNLRLSNRDMKNFIHLASHDLREPLRTISGFTSLVLKNERENLSSQGQEHLDFILTSSNEMTQLITDLMDYSLIEKSDFRYKEIDLKTTIDYILTERLQKQIQRTNAKISHNELQDSLLGHFPHIVKLLNNIIQNSLTFQKQTPEIKIASKRQKEDILISIQDNGIGISPEYHDTIFEIFRRLHSKSEFPGSGIGLAACRKIVELHKGKIWVESEEGKGSTFYIQLPINPR